MATWAQLSLQDAASPEMEELIYFHDFTLIVLAFILVLVGLRMAGALKAPVINKALLQGQALECIWTLVPALVLVQVAVPSLLLLYMLDDASEAELTIKAVGHQWYWSYEYSEFRGRAGNLEFDSYITPITDAPNGLVRLLDVDNRLVAPYSTSVSVLVSSADVLHAWAVPALGLKTDACPGRLNQAAFIAHLPGVYFGQCSEVCGANHRFMPIALELVDVGGFVNWAASNIS